MTQCQTINAGKLKLAAEKKEDESILIHIRDVDCVAAEVCYHRNCHMSYTNFSNFEVNDQPPVQLYDESFRIMCDQIVQKKIINDKEVMFMSKLYHEFKKIVSQTEGKDASNYRAFRLKQRLKNRFPQLVFHTPGHRNKSEFVFCEDLSVGSVIEESTITTNEIDDSDSELEDESCTPLKYQNLKDDSRTLFHAALILRKCITECPKFFTHWPPKIAEFSLENARSKIPAKLSNFLAWALNFSDEVIQNDVQIAIPEKDQLKVLSIAQDIIYVASRGNRQTPKALGLGMAVRQMTRSYQLTKILNGFGNAASHSAVLSLDTALAYKQLNSDVVIPNSIVKNTLTTIVWDNIDFREETATGFGTTHMTNGIIIQQQRNSSERPSSSDSAVPIKKSIRSMKQVPQQIEPYYLGKKESPNFYSVASSIDIELSQHQCPLSQSQIIDFSYIACKEIGSKENSLLPGWTGFNCIISEKPARVSRIAYLPVIDAPVTEMSTIKGILTRSSDNDEVRYSVLVFDEAVYSKVQQARWKSEDYMKQFVVRLGDFHACLSYVTAISCRFREAGLQVRFFSFS